MKDIELTVSKKINISIILIMVVSGIHSVKDYGDKKVKGILTRSFEKFIYCYGCYYLPLVIIVLILMVILSVFGIL